jgi:hypothetical protein
MRFWYGVNYQKTLVGNLGNWGETEKAFQLVFFFDLGSEKWVLGETGIPFKRSSNGLFFAMSDMAGGMEQDIKALV